MDVEIPEIDLPDFIDPSAVTVEVEMPRQPLPVIKAPDASPKVGRDAFLYMEPAGDDPDFALCKSCALWTGDVSNTCLIHGRNRRIDGDDTCGVYVHGTPDPTAAGLEQELVTPEESGLVEGPVQCQNCAAFDGRESCLFFRMLEKDYPTIFALGGDKVKAQACCNAFHPPSGAKSLFAGARAMEAILRSEPIRDLGGVVALWRKKKGGQLGDNLHWARPRLEDDKDQEEVRRACDELREHKIKIKPKRLSKVLGKGGKQRLQDDMWRGLVNSDSFEFAGRHIRDIIRYSHEKGKKFRDVLSEFIYDKVRCPIIVRLPNGKYFLVNGNTRLMICRLFGVTPKVWYAELQASDLKRNKKAPVFVSWEDSNRLTDERMETAVWAKSADAADLGPFPDVRSQNGFSCGATCFQMVCEYFGTSLTREDAANILGTDKDDGTRPTELIAGAASLGLMAEDFHNGTIETLRQHVAAGHPVIVATNYQGGHWLVVVGVDSYSVRVQDPSYGPCKKNVADFLTHWHDTDADGREYVRYGLAFSKGKSFSAEKLDKNDCHDEQGRFCSGGGGDGASATETTAGTLYDRLQREGGFTYQPVHQNSPRSGFVVSTSRENERVFNKADITPDTIKQYLDERGDVFKNDPEAHVGGWYDAEAGKVYLDVSKVVPDKETAAKLGREHNQEAIYDLGAGQTVIIKPPDERRRSQEADPLRFSAWRHPSRDRRGASQVDRGTGPPEAVGKHNECHDPDGKFCSTGGGAKAQKRTKEQPVLSEKALRAKAAHHMVDKDIQRYSEEHNEPILAKGLKGRALKDNEAADVVTQDGGKVAHGAELKTVVENKAAKVTMHHDAMERKAQWQKETGATFHTVIFDDTKVKDADGPGKHDDSQRQIYYRRGAGSFRLSSMQPVKSMKELRGLMDTPDENLPDAAKPTDQWRAMVKAAGKRKKAA